jgi:hypothetical protein
MSQPPAIPQQALVTAMAPVVTAIGTINSAITAQTALLTAAARRDDEEHERKKQAAVAKFRDLNKEELAGVDMLIKIKHAPASASWRSMASFFKEMSQRMRSYSARQRVVVLEEMCTRAEIGMGEFKGDDDELEMGAVWMVKLLEELGVAQPNISMLELPADTTLASWWTEQKPLYEFLAATIRRSRAGEAGVLAISSSFANLLLSAITTAPEHVVVRQKLYNIAIVHNDALALAAVCTNSAYKHTSLSRPVNRKAKTVAPAPRKYTESRPELLNEEVTRSAQSNGMTMSTSRLPGAESAGGAGSAIATAGGGSLLKRFMRSVAKVVINLRKPKGDDHTTTACADSGSTVTLAGRLELASARQGPHRGEYQQRTAPQAAGGGRSGADGHRTRRQIGHA